MPRYAQRKQLSHHKPWGVTVTLEHRTNGETVSVHRPGHSRREALRSAVAPFNPGEWRVRCVSTPQTIYDDLTGSRELTGTAARAWGTHRRRGISYADVGGAIPPEPTMLGQAGLAAFL